jgi:hypothetical protein
VRWGFSSGSEAASENNAWERLVKTDAEIRVGDFLLIIGHLSKQGVRRYMGVTNQH